MKISFKVSFLNRELKSKSELFLSFFGFERNETFLRDFQTLCIEIGNSLEELISFVLITFIEEVVEERYDKQIFKKLTSRFLETLKKII